jgi:hypothetical protein
MLTPTQTASGRRKRVESMRVANIVLSGSSAKNIAAKTTNALLTKDVTKTT